MQNYGGQVDRREKRNSRQLRTEQPTKEPVEFSHRSLRELQPTLLLSFIVSSLPSISPFSGNAFFVGILYNYAAQATGL